MVVEPVRVLELLVFVVVIKDPLDTSEVVMPFCDVCLSSIGRGLLCCFFLLAFLGAILIAVRRES
jgi:hypothetical protein